MGRQYRPPANFAGRPAGQGDHRGVSLIARAVWGLWRRLDPLPPGPHEIRHSSGLPRLVRFLGGQQEQAAPPERVVQTRRRLRPVPAPRPRGAVDARRPPRSAHARPGRPNGSAPPSPRPGTPRPSPESERPQARGMRVRSGHPAMIQLSARRSSQPSDDHLISHGQHSLLARLRPICLLMLIK